MTNIDLKKWRPLFREPHRMKRVTHIKQTVGVCAHVPDHPAGWETADRHGARLFVAWLSKMACRKISRAEPSMHFTCPCHPVTYA